MKHHHPQTNTIMFIKSETLFRKLYYKMSIKKNGLTALYRMLLTRLKI